MCYPAVTKGIPIISLTVLTNTTVSTPEPTEVYSTHGRTELSYQYGAQHSWSWLAMRRAIKTHLAHCVNTNSDQTFAIIRKQQS